MTAQNIIIINATYTLKICENTIKKGIVVKKIENKNPKKYNFISFKKQLNDKVELFIIYFQINIL